MPIDRPFPYPIAQPVPVTVVQGVKIPVPQPYAVSVPHPVPVPVQPVVQSGVAQTAVEGAEVSGYGNVVDSYGHAIKHPY